MCEYYTVYASTALCVRVLHIVCEYCTSFVRELHCVREYCTECASTALYVCENYTVYVITALCV